MNSEMVIAEVKKLGIDKISKTTLLRWGKEGLIPQAYTRALGRGKGSLSEYPDDAPFEFYASYCLIHNTSVKATIPATRDARRFALRVLEGHEGNSEELAQRRIKELLCGGSSLWFEWLHYKLEAAEDDPDNSTTPLAKLVNDIAVHFGVFMTNNF